VISIKNQATWTILIIILGGIAGAVFIPLFFKIETFFAICLGIIGCIFILPFIFRDPYEMQAAKVMEIGIWKSFIHPTNLPITIAAIWFVFVTGLGYILDIKIGEFKPGMNLTSILLIPFCMLMGLSGFQMIRRNEYVDKIGYVYKGFWAYTTGVVYILFGWGYFIFLVLAWIFNW
jgi:hypothetical protein